MDDVEQSILNSIKKLLGIPHDYDAFDVDIKMHINTVFSIMHQIGASPRDGFCITGPETKWSDFIENRMHVEMVKTYIYQKVRLYFDPPASSFALTAIQKQIDELEWRLNAMEIQFNPHAFDHLNVKNNVANPTWWLTEPDGSLPEGSRDGDFSIDPVTGDVWKDV